MGRLESAVLNWGVMKSTGPMEMDDPILEEIVRRLEPLGPERIYLFGSRARDDATEDSDYDILVVLPGSGETPPQLERDAYDLLWGLGVPVDIVLWRREEFDRRLSVIASLPATVVREGKLLYAA